MGSMVRPGFSFGDNALASRRDVLQPAPKLDLMRRGEGWLDFAEHVQQARQNTSPDLPIANYYAQASMMHFYLPDRPFTYLPPAPYGDSQFTLGRAIRPDIKRGRSMSPTAGGRCPSKSRISLIIASWWTISGRNTVADRLPIFKSICSLERLMS